MANRIISPDRAAASFSPVPVYSPGVPNSASRTVSPWAVNSERYILRSPALTCTGIFSRLSAHRSSWASAGFSAP